MTSFLVNRFLLIGLLSFIVTACSPQQTSVPSAVTPSPTTTLKPTQPPTVTSTATATSTPRPTTTPKPTALPTTVPFPIQDSLGLQVSTGKLKIEDSASILGKDGAVYSAYVLVDPTFNPVMYGYPDYKADSCHLVFYRWDGTTNQLLSDVSRPDQWQPFFCGLVDWNREVDPIAHTIDIQVLGLQGYESDFNQNDLPELTVFEWWCPNACDDTTGYIYSIYEIGVEGQIDKISKGLLGTIRPRTQARIVHSQDPLTIYVFYPIEYENHTYIEMDRLFAWDGNQFIDVTTNYADEYRTMAVEIVKEFESHYGQAQDYYSIDFPKILALYNLADLPREEGLALFLEVTDLSHWPGTKSDVACWLQVSRAYVQKEFQSSGNLDLPPSPDYFSLGPNWEPFLHDLENAGYDVSKCR